MAKSKGILYYDGHCGLCAWSVQFLMRHDPQQKLLYAPLQGDTAFRELPEHYRLNLSTVVYQRTKSELYERSGAILRALIDTGSRLRYPARVALWLPHCMRDCLYNCVARNRHRLFQGNPCALPAADQRSRLLP